MEKAGRSPNPGQVHREWSSRIGERQGKAEGKKRGGVRTQGLGPLRPVTREEPLLEVVKAERDRKEGQSHDPGQVHRGRGNRSRTRQGQAEEKKGGAGRRPGTGPLRPVTRDKPLLEEVKDERKRKEGHSQDPGQERRGRGNCSRRRQGKEEEKNRGEAGKNLGIMKEGRSHDPGQVHRGRGNCSRKEPSGMARAEQALSGNPRLMPVRARMGLAQEEQKRRGGVKRVINLLTPVVRRSPPTGSGAAMEERKEEPRPWPGVPGAGQQQQAEARESRGEERRS